MVRNVRESYTSELLRIPLPRTPMNRSKWKNRNGTQMGSGIERRRERPRPWPTREATPEKATEGVRMNTSKVNESAPMIVRVAQGSLMAGHGAQKLFGSFGGPGLEGTSGF